MGVFKKEAARVGACSCQTVPLFAFLLKMPPIS